MTVTAGRSDPSSTAIGAFPASPVPRRTRMPSWLDLRLVAGVALVLVSVLTGAVVMARSDQRVQVWSLNHDVAAGTVLRSADVRAVGVQLGAASGSYVPADVAVIGRAAGRPLRAGELLARTDVADPVPGVNVTVALLPENAPVMARGQRITVWVSTKTCRGLVLLSGAAVQSADKATASAFASNSGMLVGLHLSAADAARVIAALDLPGVVLRAGVLSPDEPAATPAADLTSCAAASR